jgi:hypothetical protein
MIVMFVVSVDPMAIVISRSAVVVSAIIRISAVITVRIISVIPGITVIAVPVGWVTKSDSYSSDSD